MAGALVWLVTIILFIIGLAGIVIPVVPGVGLVFAGVLFYAVVTDFATISITTVVVMGILSLLAWLADYLGAAVGAKASGGGRYSMILSAVGAIIGLLTTGPLGLFVGAFIGALVGASYEGQALEHAGKTAFYSVLGLIGATVFQLVIGVSVIVAFLIAVLV